MTEVIRSLIICVGVAFATATFLVIYESTKAGGFNKQFERHIVIFSICVAIITALALFGLLGIPGGYPVEP